MTVLIRIAEQPGGDGRAAGGGDQRRGALGSDVDYRRVEVVGPAVSGELLSYGVIGLMQAIFCILIYLWFRFEWQFALARHDRQRARSGAQTTASCR